MPEDAQLLHLVLGGELTNLEGNTFKDLDQVDIVVRMGLGHWDDGVAELVFEDESVPICSPSICR